MESCRRWWCTKLTVYMESAFSLVQLYIMQYNIPTVTWALVLVVRNYPFVTSDFHSYPAVFLGTRQQKGETQLAATQSRAETRSAGQAKPNQRSWKGRTYLGKKNRVAGQQQKGVEHAAVAQPAIAASKEGGGSSQRSVARPCRGWPIGGTAWSF